VVAQPSGTVTLVFTDIEASTRLLSEIGRDSYRAALDHHRQLLRQTFSQHQGYEVDGQGDAFVFAFSTASEIVAAGQEAIAELEPGPIRVRVGVHTGEPGLDGPGYVGIDVYRAAGISAAGHGGEVLLSQATADLVDVEVRDSGFHRLKDRSEPERLFQLGSSEFPPLKAGHRSNLHPGSPAPSRDEAPRRVELVPPHLARMAANARGRRKARTGPRGSTRRNALANSCPDGCNSEGG
jgi:class 3 adenylate cyclase